MGRGGRVSEEAARAIRRKRPLVLAIFTVFIGFYRELPE